MFLNATCCVILKLNLYGICLVSAPSKSVFLHFFVFWTALLGPFCAGLAGGASAALRAFIPAPRYDTRRFKLHGAPKVRYFQAHSSLSPPAVLTLRCARLFPPRSYATRRFSTSVLLWYSSNSRSIACFGLHFQAHSVPSPPAALVLRFARLSPPPRYDTRRFSSPVLLAFSTFCVFWTALQGPFFAGIACGASVALRAFVPNRSTRAC